MYISLGNVYCWEEIRMDTLVKMEGIPEDLLNLMIARGYFKTRTEAIRAGIMELGKEFNLLQNPKELELELVALKLVNEEQKIKKNYLNENEVKKKYNFK